MQTYDVMRQGDNGDQSRVSRHDSRIGALTQVLVLESGVAHKQVYWVSGPPGPAYRTNRDLYLHFLRLGRQAKSNSWSLSAFLRALWKVSEPLKGRTSLQLDDVAALFSAATATTPPPYDPEWSTRDLTLDHDPETWADWEVVILSQLADLEDFVNLPPGGLARFGVTAPRPAGGGDRATPPRWLNFDPAAYLECSVAGSLGGWAAGDGARVPVPGPPGAPPVTSPVREVPLLTWTDMCRIAASGQQYA